MAVRTVGGVSRFMQGVRSFESIAEQATFSTAALSRRNFTVYINAAVVLYETQSSYVLLVERGTWEVALGRRVVPIALQWLHDGPRREISPLNKQLRKGKILVGALFRVYGRLVIWRLVALFYKQLTGAGVQSARG